MPSVLESLQSFLAAQSDKHNAPELLALWSPAMETQVNVSAGDGEKVPGKGHTFENAHGDRWWNIRVPRDANSEPHWDDYQLTWPLDRHVQAIGMTGWDWQERTSRFLGFDFDAITGHAAGVGVSDDQLAEIRVAAQALPYVECRKSTSGTGLHFYVHLDAIPTANHTEHQAIARAVLGMMGVDAKFDFARAVDACGSNMWCWHTKMFGTDGFTLVKASSDTLSASDLPVNWRDHAAVVTRKRGKVQIAGLDSAYEDEFDELAASCSNVPLDDTHKRIIDELSKTGYVTVWHPDFHCVHTHTGGLSHVHKNVPGIRGVFQTISPGSDKASPNCFMFPLRDGGFKVYRFGRAPSEAPTWDSDEHYTSCAFNVAPSLSTAARAFGGAKKTSSGGGFVFQDAQKAVQALAALGKTVEVHKALSNRETHITNTKDGMVLWVKRYKHESNPGHPWSERWGGWWEMVLDVKAPQETESASVESDAVIRVAVTPIGENAGTFVRSEAGTWDCHPQSYAKMALQAHGYSKQDSEKIIGVTVLKRWQFVNLPFAPEFPGGRQWNKDAAQFRSPPADRSESLSHPHWDRLIDNLFASLTAPLKSLEWAKRANVTCGGDYGRAWLASMIRHPFEPLPYLFMWSHSNEQGKCGKSLFWEAIDTCLLSRAVVRGEKAFKGEFNGELENAVLVALDEFDASNVKLYDKFKDLITSSLITIRKMRRNAFSIPNKLHFVQSANALEKMPKVVEGDNRFTACYVPPVPKGQLIAKHGPNGMLDRLSQEAPAFLRTLLDLELPPRSDRLRLPAVDTVDKQHIQQMNQSPLERFIEQKTFHVPGNAVDLKAAWETFVEFLEDHDLENHEERGQWNKRRFSRLLPHQFPVGKHSGNKTRIGNLSLTGQESATVPFVCVGGKLVRQGD